MLLLPCSEVSSASQARRAEAVAARRQTLVQRLARLAGPAAAGGGSGSVLGGSTAVESCGRSQLGEQRGAGASPAAVDNWDRSTRAGGDDVAQLQVGLPAGVCIVLPYVCLLVWPP